MRPFVDRCSYVYSCLLTVESANGNFSVGRYMYVTFETTNLGVELLPIHTLGRNYYLLKFLFSFFFVKNLIEFWLINNLIKKKIPQMVLLKIFTENFIISRQPGKWAILSHNILMEPELSLSRDICSWNVIHVCEEIWCFERTQKILQNRYGKPFLGFLHVPCDHGRNIL